MNDMLKGWKTVVPVLELTELKGLVPADYLPFYGLAVALGNVYLRSITTTAIGKK